MKLWPPKYMIVIVEGNFARMDAWHTSKKKYAMFRMKELRAAGITCHLYEIRKD